MTMVPEGLTLVGLFFLKCHFVLFFLMCKSNLFTPQQIITKSLCKETTTKKQLIVTNRIVYNVVIR